MTDSNLPYTCHQCGEVLGTGGGRCPFCGAEQPEVTRPAERQPAPFVPTVAEAEPSSNLPLIIGGVVAVLAAGGAAAYFLSGDAPPAASSAAPPPPPPPTASTETPSADDIGIDDLTQVRPDRHLGRAKSLAHKWDRDAQLVNIDAAPVVSGAVDAKSGGRVGYRFGRATGRLGPGAAVGAEQFSVTIDANGSHKEETTGTPTKAVGSPSCPIDEAWRKMVASGVPSNSAVRMQFLHSEKYGRAVWATSVEGDEKLSRTIDGMNCTILVR